MKKVKNSIGLLILLLSVFVQTGFSHTVTFEISIDVAPAVLNLNNQGEVVTVHTDLAYSLVSVSTVYLNGIEINRGQSNIRVGKIKSIHLSFVHGNRNTITTLATRRII